MQSKEKSILLVDCQSFYASVEKATHPEYTNMPVAVAADPERRSGIILAACPIAKAYGVSTAERLSEAVGKCPGLVVIRPRMQTYISVSLLITKLYESFTPLVEPFSIDEQFLDISGSLALFGSPVEIAKQIQNSVMLSTGVWTRAGIGPTKILAKMATDNFAKKHPDGIFALSSDNIETTLWPLPIHNMFMVASRMTAHFMRMGIHTIGDLARLDLPEFKRRMRSRMGRQSDIKATYYWQTARGIDPSPVVQHSVSKPKSITRGRALRWRDYQTLSDIEPLLLELVIEVCRTSRHHNYHGSTVTVSAGTTNGENSRGFSRQTTLSDPSCLEHHIIAAAHKVFLQHWNGDPLTHLAVDISKLSDNSVYQLDLFEDLLKHRKLAAVKDAIKDRYGEAAILSAASLLKSGQARERANKIGGHYK
ncbi:DNA polymerase IV [Paenibacillus montanisoli]|uniref:DNA polymerase IV n=1 Tax=Paenibacillus montanisoli TaxID=2081970 RepID=A0A328U4K3_9BACL|nr:DNA polymerase IV [Paenibacillus montanisoli]RAP76992.1 DNA polymerase IV [Paenibacillus montanisoli]